MVEVTQMFYSVLHDLMDVFKLLMKVFELKHLHIYYDFAAGKQFKKFTKLVVLTVLWTYIQALTLTGTPKIQHNLQFT